MPKKPKEIQISPSEVQIVPQEIKYCNSIQFRITQEECIMAFHSGNVMIAQLAISPSHAKRFNDVITAAIGAYEKKVGKIDTHQKPSK